MMEIGAICAQLNDLADSLAPELLPNGRRAGSKWMFSGIPDHGKSESAYLHLSGPKTGKWFDMGNAAPGEDKGDMLDLLMLKRCHGDKGEAIREAKRILGIADEHGRPRQISAEEKARRAEAARQRAEQREQAEAEEKARKAKGAKALFLRGVALTGSPAEAYLRGRGLQPVRDDRNRIRWPGSLRFFDQVWHGPLETKLPAMLAMIVNAAGQQIGTHRIFLQQRKGVHSRPTASLLEARPVSGWGKLQGAQAKMVLGNLWGGFVPINKGASGKSMGQMPEGEPIYVTEGIEDAVAVRMAKPEARIIAAVALGNIGAIVLPPAATRLIIVADRDDSAVAQDQLEGSIARQQARGLNVELVLPPKGHKDINDWLLELAGAGQQGRKRA